MSYDNLQVESGTPVARITINRPEKLNALNQATIAELDAAFAAVEADTAVRTVVLTGSGDKAFAAGADIGEIRDQAPLAAERFSRAGQRLMRRIETGRKPVIAAINGYALGGGLELALACHLRLAGRNARIGLPEITLGLLPGFGGTQRLTRLIGRGPALGMMLTGEPIRAERAAALGLLELVDDDRPVLDAAVAMAERLAASAPLAIEAILESVTHGQDMPIDAALAFESARFGLCCASEDMREGTGAFVEKRKPRFRGC